MTNEEIIKQYTDNWEYPETYHKDDILKMLDQARKDEAIRFVEWFIKYLMLENRDKYSIEERYNQFKQSKQ